MVSKKRKFIIIFSISLFLLICCCGGLLLFLLTWEEKDVGLCLSGGGAKGAYEIGVWKALEEEGYTSKIKCISGTSVGGLNAVLLSCMSLEDAENMWRNEIFMNDILTNDPKTIEVIKQSATDVFDKALNYYSDNGGKILPAAGRALLDELLFAGTNAADYAMNMFNSPEKSSGVYSRDGLISLITENVPIDKIYDKKTPDIYITTVRKAVKGTRVFKLRDQKKDYITPILLATSAIPVAFPSVTLPEDVIINGNKVGKEYEYFDGGFEQGGGKNTNIDPLLKDEKVKTIFVVFLKSRENMEESQAYIAEKKSIEETKSNSDIIVKNAFEAGIAQIKKNQNDEIKRLEAEIEEFKNSKKENKSFENKKELNKAIDDEIEERKRAINAIKKTKIENLEEYANLVALRDEEQAKNISVYETSFEELNKKKENDHLYERQDILDLELQARAAGKEFVAIVPSMDLGNLLTGTVNFDNEKLNKMVDLGYNDTKEVLAKKGYIKQKP